MLTMAEAMLQIKYPRGGGKSSHDQTEELSVTQESNCSNVPLFNEKVVTKTSLKAQNSFDKGTKTTEASR